jgi:hypothetical protein
MNIPPALNTRSTGALVAGTAKQLIAISFSLLKAWFWYQYCKHGILIPFSHAAKYLLNSSKEVILTGGPLSLSVEISYWSSIQ